MLIVDADAAAAQRVGLALDSSGIEVGWCSFAPSELTEVLKDLKPTLLLVHAEPGSPQVMTLVARLETAGAEGTPVVLLCRDHADAGFVKTLKTGVVELWADPFNPRVHVARLKALLTELPARSGRCEGSGAPNELAAVVHHVMRHRRTGGVTVGEREEGRAFFVRGVLKSARYLDQTLQPALAAMTRTQSHWSFVEGVEGTSGVIELDAEEAPAAAAPTSPARSSKPVAAPTEPKTDRFDAPAPPAPRPSVPEPPMAPPSGPPVSLLFVDDDPAVVHMLGNFFSKKGYTVVTAADGVEALAQLTAQAFDAVIADLNMPRLDGWGLLRMVREDFRTREVPVALFSAQDNYRESLRLLHAGAQAYFPKSLRLAALEVQVKELLEPRRRFVRLIGTEGGLEFELGSLGPQWVCRALATDGFSGQLDARDGWATWRLWFAQGRLLQASARMGPNALVGDRALAAFLSATSPSGSLHPGQTPADEGFAGQPTEATLSRLVPWLADEHRRAREQELSKARALSVQDELYRLYLTVGPPNWLPIVRLLCEERLPPVEVMARLQVPPAEVAAVVKDLLRRGVVTLQ